ncbi:MAG TPA: alpha/beta hydrolase [Caldilineaceae bacterium]|nr:alpha/beta hydrolase [Caldilineaceae bacterium]
MTLTPVKSGYAPVNGLQLYYEIYGTGQPLVLIHGGFGLIGMFAALLPELAASRQVICRRTATPPISTVHSTMDSWVMTSPL